VKNILLVAAFALALTSCTTQTPYGKCIGIDDDQEPTLRYKVSPWNAVVGVVFSETVIVPVYTVLKDIQCPVGKKDAHAVLDQ
jgi:hypothetical protein